MAPKNSPRNWNDVQTAIATVAIVTTLGMWNLFATPKKVAPTQATLPPTEEPPQTTFTASTPTALPQVKIFFNAQNKPQSVTPQQQQQTTTRKKKNKNNNTGGGGGTVTTTKTS